MALVNEVRQDTHRTTRGRQRLRFAALFSCTAHHNRWWVPGARITQRSCRAVVNAVPDREIQTVLIFHLESLVQRTQYRFRPTEIGVLQGAGPERIRYRDGQQRRTDAVSANVQQIKGKVLPIDPLITKGIASQFRARSEKPSTAIGSATGAGKIART